jgi:hypothetical protein
MNAQESRRFIFTPSAIGSHWELSGIIRPGDQFQEILAVKRRTPSVEFFNILAFLEGRV